MVGDGVWILGSAGLGLLTWADYCSPVCWFFGLIAGGGGMSQEREQTQKKELYKFNV